MSKKKAGEYKICDCYLDCVEGESASIEDALETAEVLVEEGAIDAKDISIYYVEELKLKVTPKTAVKITVIK